MRYVAEMSGAVLDTMTGLRQWCDDYAEACIIARRLNYSNQ